MCGRVSGISCCAGVGKCLPDLVSMAVRKPKGDGGPICHSRESDFELEITVVVLGVGASCGSRD